MLIFHLKKKWFDLIKEGKKTHEYRIYNDYWETRINNILAKKDYFIGFMCGYKATTEENLIKAIIKTISVIDGKNTDLRYDGKVFDIEFKTELAIEQDCADKRAIEMFALNTFLDNLTSNIDTKIIKSGKYKGINYIIRQVETWHCAYIITDKKIKTSDFVAGQEITYSEDIKDCYFVKDKELGKYVIGWDYAHSYNIGTPIDSIMEDIKKAIETITEEKSK